MKIRIPQLPGFSGTERTQFFFLCLALSLTSAVHCECEPSCGSVCRNVDYGKPYINFGSDDFKNCVSRNPKFTEFGRGGTTATPEDCDCEFSENSLYISGDELRYHFRCDLPEFSPPGSLQGIEFMGLKLRWLSLTGYPDIDLSPLAELTGLYGVSITDSPALESVSHLAEDLDNGTFEGVSDISGFDRGNPGYMNLIDLSGCVLPNLDPLLRHNIAYLNVSGCVVTDVTRFVAEYRCMQYFDGNSIHTRPDELFSATDVATLESRGCLVVRDGG